MVKLGISSILVYAENDVGHHVALRDDVEHVRGCVNCPRMQTHVRGKKQRAVLVELPANIVVKKHVGVVHDRMEAGNGIRASSQQLPHIFMIALSEHTHAICQVGKQHFAWVGLSPEFRERSCFLHVEECAGELGHTALYLVLATPIIKPPPLRIQTDVEHRVRHGAATADENQHAGG